MNEAHSVDTIYPANEKDVASAIGSVLPNVIVFEYDFPDLSRLKILRHTKITHPGLPILMLTTQHCEALAVWAFRTGVRDYLVKSEGLENLWERIQALSQPNKPASNPATRENYLPAVLIPAEFRFYADADRTIRTALAVCHIEAHFNGNISMKTLAELCNMSPSAFSRAFKREQGVNFSEYIIRLRVEKGRDLLRDPRLSITEIAAMTGFNDASHFDRMFRRHFGATPSALRRDSTDQSA